MPLVYKTEDDHHPHNSRVSSEIRGQPVHQRSDQPGMRLRVFFIFGHAAHAEDDGNIMVYKPTDITGYTIWIFNIANWKDPPCY